MSETGKQCSIAVVPKLSEHWDTFGKTNIQKNSRYLLIHQISDNIRNNNIIHRNFHMAEVGNLCSIAFIELIQSIQYCKH